jgi:hypothetical protein
MGTKLIIFHNSLGEITRIGLYEGDKWVKWIKKKELDQYEQIVDEVIGTTI